MTSHPVQLLHGRTRPKNRLHTAGQPNSTEAVLCELPVDCSTSYLSMQTDGCTAVCGCVCVCVRAKQRNANDLLAFNFFGFPAFTEAKFFPLLDDSKIGVKEAPDVLGQTSNPTCSKRRGRSRFISCNQSALDLGRSKPELASQTPSFLFQLSSSFIQIFIFRMSACTLVKRPS